MIRCSGYFFAQSLSYFGPSSSSLAPEMDVREMLARDVASAEDRKAQVRRDFPWCTSFADSVRDIFGPGVKARHFVENGREMGKPVDKGNVDAFHLLDLIDMQDGYKSGSLKKRLTKGK